MGWELIATIVPDMKPREPAEITTSGYLNWMR